MQRYFLPLSLVIVFAFDACSSSVVPPASSVIPAATQQTAALAHPNAVSGKHLAVVLPEAAAKLRHHGHGIVILNMDWTRHRIARRSHYIPKTARSMSISINDGTPQYLNAPSSTLKVKAPGGIDTFLIKSYDEQNGLGNVLSLAYVTQAVVANKTATIKATLDAVVASFTLTITANANAGTAASIPIAVTAYDPDDNVIVGASDYDNPIVLSADNGYGGPYANAGTIAVTVADIYRPSVATKLSYNGGTLTTAYVIGVTGTAPEQSVAFSPTPTVYEIPVAGSPQYITPGSDGNMWYTNNNNTVVKVTKAGVLTPLTIPTSNSNPQGATLGEDGNVWFTEFNSSKIARVTPSGSISEFGTLFGSDQPQMLTDRGDGTVWYTGYGGNHIGYVNEISGIAGETTLPTGGSGPWGIAAAKDGNLYVSENLNNDMARIASLFATFAQTAVTSGSESESLVLGSDGNLWFTQVGLDHIGRVSPTSFTQTGYFPTASPSSVPVDITSGKDGALWYTESGLDRIGRMDTSGQTIGEYHTISTNTGLKGIATSPDGSIWFCEPNTSKVGRIVY